MTRHSIRAALVSSTVVALLLGVSSQVDGAARITIINANAAGVGFNDPTPVAPVGGNPGTTLGEQRLIAFRYAAEIWGRALDSNVEIFVFAQFTSLGPNVLGSAGPTRVFANYSVVAAPGFPGESFPNTWEMGALANKRAGLDIGQFVGDPPGFPDIAANFSSDFPFYLGLDNNHGPLNDLVTVVLHELGHGLGFLTLTNRFSGALFGGLPDVYTRLTLDANAQTLWHEFPTDTQRAESALNVDHVAWSGQQVTASVPYVLSLGRPELQFVAPSSLGPPVRVGTATFGPPLTEAGITAAVVLTDDASTEGPGTLTDACQPIVNDVAGRIALADRGTCTFTVKAANAQAAGAIALLVADNVVDEPPPGLGGTDPTITIPAVRISLARGDAIKAALGAGSTVTVTLGVNTARRAGALEGDLAQLWATNPIQGGSSISHWDAIASRNQLMEPAISLDLTHQLIPPFDLTLPQMRDIGWFLDANLDGAEDVTVILGTCETGLANTRLANGALLADQARVWFGACGDAANRGLFTACVTHTLNDSRKGGLLSVGQRNAISGCATAGLGTN